jgi:hypothetical protein
MSPLLLLKNESKYTGKAKLDFSKMWRDLNILLIVHGLPELLVYEDVEYDEEDERDDPVDHQVHIDDVHLRAEKLIVTCVANAVLQYYTAQHTFCLDKYGLLI